MNKRDPAYVDRLERLDAETKTKQRLASWEEEHPWRAPHNNIKGLDFVANAMGVNLRTLRRLL